MGTCAVGGESKQGDSERNWQPQDIFDSQTHLLNFTKPTLFQRLSFLQSRIQRSHRQLSALSLTESNTEEVRFPILSIVIDVDLLMDPLKCRNQSYLSTLEEWRPSSPQCQYISFSTMAYMLLTCLGCEIPKRWVPFVHGYLIQRSRSRQRTCLPSENDHFAHTAEHIVTSVRETSSDHVTLPKVHPATSYDSTRRLHLVGVV